MHIELADSEATENLGRALARGLPAQPEEAAVVVYLCGELGAGKTTCVRALLRSLGATGLIRSPTYTLVEGYDLAARHFVHVDLYRLVDPEELWNLGLRDYLAPDHVLLIEWPEKGGAGLPSPDLVITLTYRAGGRHAALRADSGFGTRWIANLEHDNSLTPYVSNLT